MSHPVEHQANPDQPTGVREDHWFTSHGTRCAAWFYPAPDGGASAPLVVIGHGLSGVRHMRLDEYARDFHAAGMAVFVFDYRGFGDSEGDLRQIVDARMQLEDWHAALAYARRELPVDTGRIAIWGTSFSGGHVMRLAAEDEQLAAAVSQAPFSDGLASFARRIVQFPPSAFVLGCAAVLDGLLGLLGRRPLLMPVAGAPWMPGFVAARGVLASSTNLVPEGSVMTRRSSRFIRWIPGLDKALGTRVRPSSRQPSKVRDSVWGIIITPKGDEIVNAIAARLVLRLAFYRPRTWLAKTGDTPILVCAADGDEVAPSGPTIRSAQACENVELRRWPVGHFEMYDGTVREEVVGAQVQFLQRCFGLRDPASSSSAPATERASAAGGG